MRIVSLSPSVTEIFTALGAGSEVTEFPSKPVDLSKIESLSPDWVLADACDSRPEGLEALQRKRKVKIFDVKRLEEVCDTVVEVGRLTRRHEEASRLIETIRNEERQNQTLCDGREKKRTILLVWHPPYLTVNFDAYASRLLEASGGVNVFREEPLREFPVEMEEMIEKNPEVLLLAGKPGPFEPRHVKGFRQYRIFNRIPIHLLDSNLLTHYGPKTAEALRRFREIYGSLG